MDFFRLGIKNFQKIKKVREVENHLVRVLH